MQRQKPPRTVLRSSVASKFWKVVLNLRFSSKDFLREQVLLVEEQNHRDGAQPSNREEGEVSVQEEKTFFLQGVSCACKGSFQEERKYRASGQSQDPCVCVAGRGGGLGGYWQEARGMPHRPVVPDAFEEVQGLLQAVGLVVLPNDHVVAAAGHHEDNGSHICGTRKQKQCMSEVTKALTESEQNVLTEKRRLRLRTIEALDPLAALVALAAHVKHAAGDRGHGSLPAANPFQHSAGGN